jgi:transposase InsO family protein
MRFVTTKDSNHDGPIFSDLVRDQMVDGPNEVWVADITYIAIAVGFVYVYMVAILDAWSRRVVGYAIRHQNRRTDPGNGRNRALLRGDLRPIFLSKTKSANRGAHGAPPPRPPPFC